MRMIIPTCDKYINILEAGKYCLDKFGGKDFDVTLLGFVEPEFDIGSWKFQSLGVDRGPTHLTSDLWKFFKDFDDECFILNVDDGVQLDDINFGLLKDMS